MADIEWTDRSDWNPVRGCTRESEGCRFCYAEAIAARFSDPGLPFHGYAKRTRGGPRWTGLVLPRRDRLTLPLRWRRPARVFVNSTSDIFHERLPASYIGELFAVMSEASKHQFQILTKRGARLAELAPSLPWPPNVWMGVSVESAAHVDRIDHLRTVPAAVRFVSAEPLLGPLDGLDLSGVHWVIVGGESGSDRAMNPAWARSLRDQCAAAGVPFFMKQMGGRQKARMPAIPDDLMVRQWPAAPRGRGGRAAKVDVKLVR